MIGKIIALRQEIRSADHGLAARIDYVAAKATYIDTPCIPGGIDVAAAQMAATCQRHRRNPRTAHVHIVLSWPAREVPSDNQARVAAKHAMARLGAEGHEAVIGVHRDTAHIHVHTIYSRVHPITGRLVDRWQDYTRLELACREIELLQGWARDNGRFRVEIDDTGPVPAVRLVPRPAEDWALKQARRKVQADLRQGDIDQARISGHLPLHLRLPIEAMTALRQGVESAKTWAEVLARLGRFGLGYRKTPRGAVIHLRGGSEAVAVSRLIPGESHAELVARLGPLPDQHMTPTPMPPGETRLTIRGYGRGKSARIGRRPAGARAQVGALHMALLDDLQLRDQIAVINLAAPRRMVFLRDGGWVTDLGEVIRMGGPGAIRPRIEIALKMIAARGWATLDITDDTPISRALMRAAADRGITTLMPPDPTGALLRVRLRRAAAMSGPPVLPPPITAALAARAEEMHRNDLSRTARRKDRAEKMHEAEDWTERIADDLADLPSDIRKTLLRAANAALRERARSETDLRRGLTRAAPLDLFPQLRPALHSAREIAPERITVKRMTFDMVRALHEHFARRAKDDPQGQPVVFEDLLHPRPDLWLLAHRDRTGTICGYEYALWADEPVRTGMVAGSTRGLGKLPEPARKTDHDLVPTLAVAIRRLSAVPRTGTQLLSLAGPRASPDAEEILRAGLVAPRMPEAPSAREDFGREP
ncbi:relaxase/mobilization nuclease domain-containing protein [Rhodobacter capsulatus]|uniref:Relaxase/mobilization nuclease domain protein n=1 Tax=Rhodobacter capsulatus (strain ATCC BAA-309 / NBRC 16581 / SB1003) TaxID=272942 RepID=D5ASE6_RHOCB|nr:relaxase/mobilization nuclease domain-containing protein [Rhodobacter capsulatus]ADE85037.1 relaxase/mobilization nuclease domain protein [Rhodobacter capsulatus SB 1003]ETD02167.1 hypothetical protein U714_07635 [Rhodobacter capsulatus DE442]ETD77857.1 hypothetical protein U717_07810 [Rhodobacter capsulatus R121]ETE54199.1 hypothetical protein U715_07805 [Rhodobacter capsulatus Y262]MDS0926691.1 relaxase/mobilization nuclease domain-containing protein [Rhodobacter capsulatus]